MAPSPWWQTVAGREPARGGGYPVDIEPASIRSDNLIYAYRSRRYRLYVRHGVRAMI
jgi:hypothetical protein